MIDISRLDEVSRESAVQGASVPNFRIYGAVCLEHVHTELVVRVSVVVPMGVCVNVEDATNKSYVYLCSPPSVDVANITSFKPSWTEYIFVSIAGSTARKPASISVNNGLRNRLAQCL